MEQSDREGVMQTASATECTGAVPALADAAAEANCRRLCGVRPAKRARRVRSKGQ